AIGDLMPARPAAAIDEYVRLIDHEASDVRPWREEVRTRQSGAVERDDAEAYALVVEEQPQFGQELRGRDVDGDIFRERHDRRKNANQIAPPRPTSPNSKQTEPADAPSFGFCTRPALNSKPMTKRKMQPTTAINDPMLQLSDRLSPGTASVARGRPNSSTLGG